MYLYITIIVITIEIYYCIQYTVYIYTVYSILFDYTLIRNVVIFDNKYIHIYN